MESNTILVAVGDEDADRVDAFVRAAGKVADPADARVVVAHAVPEAEYADAVETVSAGSGNGPLSVTPISGTLGTAGGADPAAADRELSEAEVLAAVVNGRSVVRKLADGLADAGIAHEVQGGVGDPADRIAVLADELGADFVVVGGRDRSPARQALFGSVSQEIIRSVDAPVIAVRGG